MSIDDDPQPQPRYEGIGDDSTDPEYTTASGDDCGAVEADPATDDGSQPTDGSQPKRQKKREAPEQARYRQGGIYRSGQKWASNGAQRISRWVRRTTRVHSPGHRLDQLREPKAS